MTFSHLQITNSYKAQRHSERSETCCTILVCGGVDLHPVIFTTPTASSTTNDLGAIYDYSRSIPAIENAVIKHPDL